MILKILSTDGTEKGKIEMPEVFSETLREDIIKRAVMAILENSRHPFGSMIGAGLRHSSKISRRRRDYKTSYGHGISRVPRKIMSHRGTRFNWVAAESPQVVGGRRAHPAKVSKVFTQKINFKENQLAIRSALSAALNKELVVQHGHKAPDSYPFIIDDSIESISKTKDLVSTFEKLGFGAELIRTSSDRKRAGRGKSRGRKYIERKGLLMITANPSSVQKSVANIPGFEVIDVKHLNTYHLAPGYCPGRMILLTKSAVESIKNNHLFTAERKDNIQKSAPAEKSKAASNPEKIKQTKSVNATKSKPAKKAQ